MKESNILSLIKLTKDSEKEEKDRSEFLEFISKTKDDAEPIALINSEVMSMMEEVFIVANPSSKLGAMKRAISDDDGEVFLSNFNYNNRRWAAKLWEYKKTEKALISYFKLTIYKGLVSSSSFVGELNHIDKDDMPNMISAMARANSEAYESYFTLSYITTTDKLMGVLKKSFLGGTLRLEYKEASENLQQEFNKVCRGYVYRNWNAFGTTTDQGSFCMIGFKGEAYNPDTLDQENCTFSITPTFRDVRPIDEGFSAALQEKMMEFFKTTKGENTNSSQGLDVTFGALIDSIYTPLVLQGLGADSEKYPIQLTIDKKGTTVYVDPVEIYSVLAPLSYAMKGESKKEVADFYYDSVRNSLLISTNFSYSYVSTAMDLEKGTREEYNNTVPFCGEVKCIPTSEHIGKVICAVNLTDLSPTITLKEKLSDKPIVAEYLEVPAKILRENPGLQQFIEKENALLSIKNDKELYDSLGVFMEKYVNTYAPLQKKNIIQQVGKKQKESEVIIRWLDESKDKFNHKTNPNIDKLVLQVRESYWQNNTALDIEKTFAYFCSKGADPYYRLLCIQILGVDYLKFTFRIVDYLIKRKLVCISDMSISESTGLPLYYGVLPFLIEYTSEYASGNVYATIEKLEKETESYINSYFGSKMGSEIVSNQMAILNAAKPLLMKFRWGSRVDVINKLKTNQDLSEEEQVKYKQQELRTITVNVNDEFIEAHGRSGYGDSIFGKDISKDYFIDWLRGEGTQYIKAHIQVNTESGGGVALPNLISDSYVTPLQKGLFIKKYLNELLLVKRNYKTGENVTEKGSDIKKTITLDIGVSAGMPSISLTTLSSNTKGGLRGESRDELAEWGYIDDTQDLITIRFNKYDSDETYPINKEDAKRLWSILETLYYEKTSDIKVEGQRLYNLFVQTTIMEKSLPKANHTWNSKFNNFAKPNYSLIPVIARHSYYFKSETTKPFNLRGAQKQGLKFLSAYNNGGLLAHEVGFGKTTTAITKCSELIVKGNARRILIIVPNVVYDNWITEISGGKDKEGNPIIGLLGNSIKVIPLGNLGLSDLMGKKRLSKTPIQKKIIAKDGKFKGTKIYTDETDTGSFDEVGAITKSTEIQSIILSHIGQYSRVRGAKIPGGGKAKESKLGGGGLLRYSDRSIQALIEVSISGWGNKTADVDEVAAIFNKELFKKGEECDSDDLIIGKRRYSGNADLSTFVSFVEEILADAIPNFGQSPALSSIVPDINTIATDVRNKWIEELTTVGSNTNKEFRSAYAYTNKQKEFEKKEYCGDRYSSECSLDGCFRYIKGWKSGDVEQLPDFRFWIHKEYTKLEKQLTDRVIWYFRKLRGTLVGKMGKWKDWAIQDNAILMAKHSAIENIKVPQIYVNQAIVDASDSGDDKYSLDRAPDFYKGFSLPLRHNSIVIEDLNVDALIVDEIHNFNRIIDKVQRRVSNGKNYKRLYGKAINNQTDGAESVIEYSFKSNSLPTMNKFNLFALSKYIQNRKNQQQNTILLSATPFTDDNYQLLSLFNMIDKSRMDGLGVPNAYEFYMKYVIEEWKWDINQRNQFGLFAKIEGYNNGYALSSFIKSFGNFKISDKEIERRRPIKYTISSSRQDNKQISDVTSVVDLSPVQLRMVNNISKFTNGDTTTVNEFGFDLEMMKKSKKSKKSVSETKEQWVDQEWEEKMIAVIDGRLSNEGDTPEVKQLIQELTNFNTNSLWVATFQAENNPDAEDEEKSAVDGTEAIKSGAAGDSVSNAKAFQGQSLNLKLAISPYLISGNSEGTVTNPLLPSFGKDKSANAKNFILNSPKLEYAINCSLELLLHHKDKKESPSGQVFYLNSFRFTYGGVGYNIFELITQYMVDICADPKSKFFALLDEEQIKFLISDTTSKNREAIKTGFLNGEVLILMGTSTIKEGINLQENATIMYILNAEFSPVKMMQLQGRIWRQGNNWKNCFIINVLARRSLDAFVFSKLDKKITAVREMLDSDVYEMDATQFTMDAHQIKIELTTDVKQLVKIGWIETEKELESLRVQESIKLESLKGIKENYQADLESSAELKEKFNKISLYYSAALRDYMIKTIIRAENKIRKDKAIEKKQSASKTPLTSDQIKMIKYTAITEAEAIKLINDTEAYTPTFEHQDISSSTTSYVVLSTQLKRLLEGLLIVDIEYQNIERLEKKSKESISGKSKDFKAEVIKAEAEFKKAKKEIEDSTIDESKLSLPRRMIRFMHDSGYKSMSYDDWYGVDLSKFENEVDRLIGGTGISKTLSDYSIFIESEGKKFSQVDSLIKAQETKTKKAENLARDSEGQKKILTEMYTKEMASRNDPKKIIDIAKAVKTFKKIFPLIEKK